MDNPEKISCPMNPTNLPVTLKSPFSKEVLNIRWDVNAKESAPEWIKIIKYLITKSPVIAHHLGAVNEQGEKVISMAPFTNEDFLSVPNGRNQFEMVVKAFNSACEMMSAPARIESPAGTPSSTRNNVNMWRKGPCDPALTELICGTIFSLSKENIEKIAYPLRFLLDVLFHQDVVTILGPNSDFSALYLAGASNVKRVYGIVVEPTPAEEAATQFEKLLKYFGKTETPFVLYGKGYSPYIDDYLKESTVYFVNNAPMDKETERELIEFVANKIKKSARIICTKSIGGLSNNGLKMDKKEKRHKNKTVFHVYTFKKATVVSKLTTEAFTPKPEIPDNDGTEYEPKPKKTRSSISISGQEQIATPNTKTQPSNVDMYKFLDETIASLQSAKKTVIEENDSKFRLHELLAEREKTIKNLEEQIRSGDENFEKIQASLENKLATIEAELKSQEILENEAAVTIRNQREKLVELEIRIQLLESVKPRTSQDFDQVLKEKNEELAQVKIERDKLQKQLHQVSNYNQMLNNVLGNSGSVTLPANKEPKKEPP